MRGDSGLGDGDWGFDPKTAIVSEPGVSGRVQSYEDLRVWNGGVALAEAVYEATRTFPQDERFGLTSQLRRAAVSIPSNIAEGWGRGSRADYRRFILQARGSLYEVETQLLLASRFGYLSDDDYHQLRETTQTLSRQILGLVHALASPKSP